MTDPTDRFASASGPDADGMIHRLTPSRRNRWGVLFALCGASPTLEEFPTYQHVDCPRCARVLAGRPEEEIL
jgi:hypothetical protein